MPAGPLSAGATCALNALAVIADAHSSIPSCRIARSRTRSIRAPILTQSPVTRLCPQGPYKYDYSTTRGLRDESNQDESHQNDRTARTMRPAPGVVLFLPAGLRNDD